MSSAIALDRTPEADLVLANARLVLADAVIAGSVLISDGVIADIAEGNAVPRGGVDCAGALLIPGLVELHTDNLEKHLRPRPGVTWPYGAAVLAHDGELAAAGITTVFDAIRAGTLRGLSAGIDTLRYAREIADQINRLVAARALKIEHLLHIRAELCSYSVLDEMDEFGPEDPVRIVSIMDHTPGQRQFADEAKYRHYYQTKHGLSDAEMDAFIGHTKDLFARVGAEHEAGVVARAKALGAVIASHDDTTADHVAASVALGVGFAEFPTTMEAAQAYHAASVPVMMGAPNILRGGSHSGNVAAIDLAEVGVLDILSSDYAPSAMLMGAMHLAERLGDMPGAVGMVTRNPARAVGLEDRGEIAIGKRADLVTLRPIDGLSVVTGVWSGGRKVG